MSHLTFSQRYVIETSLLAGESKTYIAKKIKVDKSVVSREVNRNKDLRNGNYRAALAQKKYDQRIESKPKRIRFTQQIIESVKLHIMNDLSPEQTVGIMKKNGDPTVSHERIYQFIWDDKKQKGDLHTHLRRKGRRYRKRGASKDSRGVLVGRIGIENRPKEAESRTVFGHLEVDTIIGKNHIGAIITLNDRASGMLWMRKIESRDAFIVKQKLSEMLLEIKPNIKSITADNGKEFAQHQYFTKEFCDFFFANPYSPWERGSNENLNGLIRQYIPKSSDFCLFSNDYIMYVQNKINNRPRKRFNYENPIFVMNKLLSNPKVAFVV